MSRNNKIIGKFGEKIAVNYLENLGYKIICENYKCRCGEIDLISVMGNEVTFTEVKTRTNLSHGYPFEAVNENKLKKIKKASQYFLSNDKFLEDKDYDFKFDVISIILSDEFANAILTSKDPNLIDISNLRDGVDYTLEHLADA